MSRRRPGPSTALAIVLLVGSCAAGQAGGSPAGGFVARLLGRRPPPPPVATVHYIVGEPYQQGGVWHYPRPDFSLDETGLAAIAPARRGLTTDGEIADPGAMAAGHATLQLPSIARVTNLENGRSILVRVNTRGPASPARVLELTPRAAQLLEARDGTELRIQVQEAESRQLAATLGGDGPRLEVAVAPAGEINAETLALPRGAQATGRLRFAPSAPVPMPSPSAGPAAPVPDRLPEQIQQWPATPGRLYIDAGSFSRAQYARVLAGRLAGLGAEVVTDYAASRDQAYQVRLGPFGGVAEADAALDRARRSGVTDGRIVVQP